MDVDDRAKGYDYLLTGDKIACPTVLLDHGQFFNSEPRQ
jgi:hypothetical protein